MAALAALNNPADLAAVDAFEGGLDTVTLEASQPDDEPADRPVAVMADEALALMSSDREAAMALALRALRRAEACGDADGRCHALLVVANISLRRIDYSAAQSDVQEALTLGSGHSNPHLRDLAQHARAVWMRREGDATGAMAMLAELHTRAHERPPLHAYFTVSILSVAQGMAGDYESALRSSYEALELAKHCGSLSVEVNALNNAGAQHFDICNFEDALPLFERCLEGALRLGSRRQTIFAAANLTQCLGAMGMPTRALAVAREHLMPLVRPDDDAILNRDGEIAEVLMDNGLLDDARTCLERQLRHDPQSSDQSDFRAWLEARLMMADGQAREALAHCQARQALRADTFNAPVTLDVQRLAELAAAAAAACGDHAEAYRQMCLAHGAQIRMLDRAARARVTSLQIRHEVQRAVQERDDALRTSMQLAALNKSLQAQVEANQRLNTRLKAMALEDLLTGLPNRRQLFEAGPALLQHAVQGGLGVSAAMIDLDHFKQINDRYGHEGGDRVLKAFSEQARAMVRSSDLLCRYGGEEFVMLLGGCDQLVAARRVRDLLARFSALAVEAPGGEQMVSSFSAGISSLVDAGESLDGLLKRADLALYEAKRQGRRRVELADSLHAPAGARSERLERRINRPRNRH